MVGLGSTKQEFENMVTNTGVIWFVDENEARGRRSAFFLLLYCAGSKLLDSAAGRPGWREQELGCSPVVRKLCCPSRTKKEHDTLEKEGRATKRRRKDGLSSAKQKQA